MIAIDLVVEQCFLSREEGLLVMKERLVMREVRVHVVLLVKVMKSELETEMRYGPLLGMMTGVVHCRVECCIYWNNYCPQDLVVMVF